MSQEHPIIKCLMTAVGCEHPPELKEKLTKEEKAAKAALLEKLLDERNRDADRPNGS